MSGRSCWRPAGSAWTRPATGSCWDTRGEWPQRIWAVEGANGTGRPLAARLLADGEYVVDVPAKLAARIRIFDIGHGRKNDATDAHAITMAALRTRGPRQLRNNEDLAVLRLLADRRDELSRTRAQTLNRLHRLLAELIPGGAPRHLSVLQAKALLGSVRPQDAAGRTRRALAAELIGEIDALDGKLKQLLRGCARTSSPAAAHCWRSSGSARPAPPGSSPMSTMWPVSPTATGSPPGPAPPPSTPPPASMSGTGWPAPATAASTTSCSSPRSSRSATTPPAAPTTGGRSPRARPRWRPCAACAGACPMWSTASSSPTPPPSTPPPTTRRAREGTRGLSAIKNFPQ